MSEILGRDIEVGLATEATRGTAETTVDRWAKNVSANIVERAEHAQDDSVHGSLADMDGRRVVQKWVEGDLEGIAHVDVLGYIYASLYGKVATTTVSGSVKSHEFTLRENIEHQSLTIFAKDGAAQQLKYAGCMVNTFELNATVDDYVRYTASFVGRTATDDTATPSYNTEYDFIGKDIVVKIADTEAGLSGATAIPLKEITISHDQGGIRDHVFGAYTPNNTYNAKMGIEGEFVLNFTDETYKDLYLGDDDKYMSVTIEGDADLGGGNNPSITYVFNKVQFSDWNRSGSADELVTQPISFKAFYNATDDEQSKVTLQNLTSAYANVPSN